MMRLVIRNRPRRQSKLLLRLGSHTGPAVADSEVEWLLSIGKNGLKTKLSSGRPTDPRQGGRLHIVSKRLSSLLRRPAAAQSVSIGEVITHESGGRHRLLGLMWRQ